MKTIWKYPLQIRDKQQIDVPEGALFLSAIEQDDRPVLYFLVELKVPLVPLDIVICGTGHPRLEFLDTYHFLGTVSTRDGSLIWHIFTKWR